MMPIISAFALVFQHAPLPTSPVDGGGAATPSPPAGRAGVGAVLKSLCKDTYYSPHRVRLRRERPVAQSHSSNTMSNRNQSMISSSHRIYRVPRRRVSLRARHLRCLHARLESLASSSHFPSRISRSICHRCRRTSSPRKAIPNSHSHRLIVSYMLILSMELVCSFIEHSIQYGTEQSLPLFCKLAQQRN